MKVYVLPVSGGAFPIQLGLLSECGAAGYQPDIVMGSSGGNVATYIGLAANWQADAIPTIATKINSTMFVQSWWPRWLSILPSIWIGYFMGSVYASGSGSLELFKTSFTPESIVATEVWTGTMNRETGKGQLFCNRKESDARIRRRDDDLLSSFRMRDCMPLTYLNGDMEAISSVTIASAAIPVLVPEQQILGARYVDGGTLFSSPLTALQDCLLDLAEEDLHIDYFSSFDMQATSTASCRNLYDNGTTTIGEMVKSLCIQDRLVAIEMLRDGKRTTPHFVCMDGNQDNLKRIGEVRKKCRRSVLELYPVKNDSMDLLSFTPADILRLIQEARTNYKIRFWWVGDVTEQEVLPSTPSVT